MTANLKTELEQSLALRRELLRLRAEKEAKLQTLKTTRLSRYREAPVPFTREVLGDKPWGTQGDILNSVYEHRRVVVPSCFGSGKTWVAARLVLQWCSTDDGSIAITTASVGRQVRGQLWGEMRQAFNKTQVDTLPGRFIDTDVPEEVPGEIAEAMELPGRIMPRAAEWVIGPKNFAIGFATREPERFSGWHSRRVLVVLDEAEGIPEAIWEQMEGQLVSEETAVIALGNPMEAAGGFYRAATSPRWHTITISAYDTPNFVAGEIVQPELITPGWVEGIREEYGEDSPFYVSKVLGQFPDIGDKTIVPLSWFERAVDRAAPFNVGAESREAGLDIARYGQSFSAIVIRQGPLVIHAERKQGLSGTAAAGWALRTMRDHGCYKVKGDATGVGGPVLDIMREAGGIEVVDVHGAGKPMDDEQFSNLRAETWWGYRKRFEENQISIPRAVIGETTTNQLKAESTALHYKFNSRGQIVVESKEEAERRRVPSPDLADAAVLAFASIPEVAVTGTIRDKRHRGR